MGYTRVDSRFENWASAQWYLKEDLERALKVAEEITFAKAADRQAAHDAVSNIPVQVVYALNTRFPATGRYLARPALDWNSKFSKFFAALASGDAHQGVTSVGGVESPFTSGKGAPSSGREFADAATSYYNTIRIMFNQLEKGDGVYGRREFEVMYEWVVGLLVGPRITLQDIFETTILLTAEQVRCADSIAALQRRDWPGLENTVSGADEPDNIPRLPARNMVIYIWSPRSEGRRMRFMLRIVKDVVVPIEADITETAD